MKILSFFRKIFTPGNIALVVVGTLLILLFFNIFGIVRVSGASMDPTLSDGQFLVGLRVNRLPFVTVSRGDIITVTVEELGTMIIKRVIAIPGDRVKLVDGQLYLNGELQYEPYIYEPMNDIPSNTIDEFTVPDGQYYVLGDNRNISHDSRAIGCVDKQDLQTLVLLKHQVTLTAVMAVCILIISCLASELSTFVDLRWSAYAAAKKARKEEETPAEPENEQEETYPQEDCNPGRDVL